MNSYREEIELYFELKNTPESSRESYLRRAEAFIKYLQDGNNKCLEETTEEDIQQYILYLKNKRLLSAGTINNYISAVRFLWTHVLNREWDSKKIPRMRRKVTFPVIPPKQDLIMLLNSVENLKHKSMMLLMYGSGLRVSEVVRLRICDICGKTMRVRVDKAKHDTNRYTILSETALTVLRDYFRAYFSLTGYKPDDWLFPGQNRNNHITAKTIKNVFIEHRNKLGLHSNISAHTLRHCFATHCLENGVAIAFIQQLLGHRNIKTTMKYLHMTSKSMMGIKSPLDDLE